MIYAYEHRRMLNFMPLISYLLCLYHGVSYIKLVYNHSSCLMKLLRGLNELMLVKCFPL